MNEIKCPNCKTNFKIDETHYSNILSQIRNNEFEKEIEKRIIDIEKNHKKELLLIEENVKNNFEKKIIEKNSEITKLENKIKNEEKEKDLLNLKNETILNEKIAEYEKLILELKSENKNLKKEKEFDINKLEIEKNQEKELELNKLKTEKEKELQDVKNKLAIIDMEKEIEKKSIIEKYELELKQKDDTIYFYKDFKAKQSTKMIGESLEQHCETEFNKIRMAAFPNAYFGKDNDVKTGSKGDYIYREYDESGEEIISIMFEMKNEADETATKKKNEHFFKELHKDRLEKKCEYAILVSMLENDNDFYNNGIVDVSYHYEKMYVIRPQFFIPIITLLRNASLNSLKYKKEVTLMREQNIDITNFENDLAKFKESFSKNYDLASRKFKTAIEEIDKTIIHLQKTKDALISSDNNLRIANKKIDDITVKKLVRKNPTMKEKFEKLKDE